MRELTRFEPISLNRSRDVGSQLMALARSAHFKKSEEYFKGYPPNSLLSDRVRAFLNIVIRALQPDLMLEIGTYRAGTTEVIARSLWSNNKGKLITIDPYEPERARTAIAQWPDALQRYVEYLPEFSMQFFANSAPRLGRKFDVIFVDGGHDYETALFDITASAKFLVAGGVIVLDNAEASGVISAARHFTLLHRGWKEVTGVLENYSAKDPFLLCPSPINTLVNEYKGWMDLVLVAPRHLTIGETPSSFELDIENRDSITGLRLTIADSNASGTIFVKIYLRTFPSTDSGEMFMPEEIVSVQSETISKGQQSVEIRLTDPLKASVGSPSSVRKSEVLIAWNSTPAKASFPWNVFGRSRVLGDDGTGSVLRLTGAPEFLDHL